MKLFEEMNYYEILKVPVSASVFEIKQAYAKAVALYGEESLVTYGMFSDSQRVKLLRTLETAFLTLIDADQRIAYDAALLARGDITPEERIKKETRKPEPMIRPGPPIQRKTIRQRVSEKAEDPEIRRLAAAIAQKEVIVGDDFRRIREALGVSRDDVYSVTRISVSIVQAIETDQHDRLPSQLYLKNFLKTYADLLGLPAEAIMRRYLASMPPALNP